MLWAGSCDEGENVCTKGVAQCCCVIETSDVPVGRKHVKALCAVAALQEECLTGDALGQAALKGAALASKDKGWHAGDLRSG